MYFFPDEENKEEEEEEDEESKMIYIGKEDLEAEQEAAEAAEDVRVCFKTSVRSSYSLGVRDTLL